MLYASLVSMLRRSYFFKLCLLNISYFSLMSYLDSLPRKETMRSIFNFERGFERYLPNKKATISIWRLILLITRLAWLVYSVEVTI